MCGIFGYLGPRQASDILLDGLRRLEYRGYDSTGIAVKDETIQIFKKVGKVADLESVLPNKIAGTQGIAHTRWATHGVVSDANSHPHS
ncbi:MAG: glutamine--fructose-6-phosphate aminotransferase, partial [Euryarchaeota archaeon]|nr:glutamine--fructose-6-phosphate aminotransferase [Euryarchaeota archaeon]